MTDTQLSRLLKLLTVDSACLDIGTRQNRQFSKPNYTVDKFGHG